MGRIMALCCWASMYNGGSRSGERSEGRMGMTRSG